MHGHPGTGHGGKQPHYIGWREMVFFDFHGRAMHGFTSLLISISWQTGTISNPVSHAFCCIWLISSTAAQFALRVLLGITRQDKLIEVIIVWWKWFWCARYSVLSMIHDSAMMLKLLQLIIYSRLSIINNLQRAGESNPGPVKRQATSLLITSSLQLLAALDF